MDLRVLDVKNGAFERCFFFQTVRAPARGAGGARAAVRGAKKLRWRLFFGRKGRSSGA